MNNIPNCPGGLPDADVPEQISLGNVTWKGVEYTVWKHVVTEEITWVNEAGEESPLPEGVTLKDLGLE